MKPQQDVDKRQSGFRPQLAVAWEKPLDQLKYPVIAEPKLDGVRCLCIIKDGNISFWSRDEKEFVNFDELKEELIKDNFMLVDIILDGEILATSGNFDDTISRARSHNGKNTHIDYVFHVFDVYHEKYSLLERKKAFMDIINQANVPHMKANPWVMIGTPGQLQAYCLSNELQGFEGTMVKKIDGYYHNGRNQDWKKIKPFKSADLKITGMTAGQGKASGMMGRIMVQGRVEDIEGLEQGQDPCEAFINVKCEVGTGFTDELRKKMWNNIENYIGKYVEIQYQEVTKDNSLRFPSFKRFRDDKQQQGDI